MKCTSVHFSYILEVKKKKRFVALYGLFMSSQNPSKLLSFLVIHVSNTPNKITMPTFGKGVPGLKLMHRRNDLKKALFPTHNGRPPAPKSIPPKQSGKRSTNTQVVRYLSVFL